MSPNALGASRGRIPSPERAPWEEKVLHALEARSWSYVSRVNASPIGNKSTRGELAHASHVLNSLLVVEMVEIRFATSTDTSLEILRRLIDYGFFFNFKVVKARASFENLDRRSRSIPYACEIILRAGLDLSETFHLYFSGFNCGYLGEGSCGSVKALKMLGVKIDKYTEEKFYRYDYIGYGGALEEFKFNLPHEIVKNLEKRG